MRKQCVPGSFLSAHARESGNEVTCHPYPSTSPCECLTLFALAEPANKHRKTIFSVQYAIWQNEKRTLELKVNLMKVNVCVPTDTSYYMASSN